MSLAGFTELNHPLIKSYLTVIRDKKTGAKDFSDYVERLAILLACETSRFLRTGRKKIDTPLESFNGYEIIDEIVLLPILRAGLGLVTGFQKVFVNAKTGHIGIFRNESTLEPVSYYYKFPAVKEKKNAAVFILDPMLATGGSVNYAISVLKKSGIKRIIVCSLVSAPYGINNVLKKNRGIKIVTCALDRKLNSKGFIIPGLGDAGDRLFGT